MPDSVPSSSDSSRSSISSAVKRKPAVFSSGRLKKALAPAGRKTMDIMFIYPSYLRSLKVLSCPLRKALGCVMFSCTDRRRFPLWKIRLIMPVGTVRAMVVELPTVFSIQ